MRHIQLFSQKAMMQQQHQFIAFLSFFKLLVSELVNISCCVKIEVSILGLGYWWVYTLLYSLVTLKLYFWASQTH